VRTGVQVKGQCYGDDRNAVTIAVATAANAANADAAAATRAATVSHVIRRSVTKARNAARSASVS